MGRPKALLHIGEETFVERLVRTLAAGGAAPVVVVVAPEGVSSIEPLLSGRALLAINHDPDRGQLSSVQCGLAALPDGCSGALITPVDLPLVAAATVRGLLDAWCRAGADIVRPRSRDGRHGHPVLASARVLASLLSAPLDRTTRDVLRGFAASTRDVLVDDEGAFADVDTPAEYERLIAGPTGADT